MDAKKRIFTAAVQLFYEHGYWNTSIREIAENAEVSVAMINYHYRSKDKLFLEVIRAFEEKLVLMINYYEQAPTSDELLFHFILESTHFCLANKTMSMLYFREKLLSSCKAWASIIKVTSSTHYKAFCKLFHFFNKERDPYLVYITVFGLIPILLVNDQQKDTYTILLENNYESYIKDILNL